MTGIDFFLSHNRSEKAWTRALNACLQERGATTFFDEESISVGQDIVSAIDNALRRSRHVVFILSPRSVQSAWVELEWTAAVYGDPDAREKRVLPVLVEDCDIPFLLRRLRYVDARGSDVSVVADQLISAEKDSSHPTYLQTVRQLVVETAAPLRFGSPQYIQRECDVQLDNALARGESVILYGPRMVGKTSMLMHLASRERLRGNRVIWLDLMALPSPAEDANAFLIAIADRVARQLNVVWRRSDLDSTIVLQNMLAEAISATGKPAVLLVDEYDVLSRGPAGAQFGSLLRALLSDPLLRSLSCVAAGLLPPWLWTSPELVSPWWDIFHLVRVPYFNPEQVATFCGLLGGGAVDYADLLSQLTGGHPALVAKAGYEYLTGQDLDALLSDPLRPDGPFLAVASVTVSAAMRLVGDRRDVMIRLHEGREVPRSEDREALWLMGLVNDPRDNPPVVRGTLFLELMTGLLDQ